MSILDKKVREGTTLEVGQRGSNKVSAMAAHLAASIQTEPSKQSTVSDGFFKLNY